jgi:hypothetical protein
MDAKQSQQHRQHFNLSESAKQMLEELTAQRYPGKQRRQSQLIEDLVTEAFIKEHGMDTVTSMQNPDRFASSTLESLNMAQQEAFHKVSGHQQIKEETQNYTAVSMTLSVCPSCKRKVQLGWKHCVFCGTSVAKICPKCATRGPQIEGVRFCFECGSPLLSQ